MLASARRVDHGVRYLQQGPSALFLLRSGLVGLESIEWNGSDLLLIAAVILEHAAIALEDSARLHRQ